MHFLLCFVQLFWLIVGYILKQSFNKCEHWFPIRMFPSEDRFIDVCSHLQHSHSPWLSAADCTDVISITIDTFFCVV